MARLIYVDDLVLNCNDHLIVARCQRVFVTILQTSAPKYFLGVEVARSL